MRRRARVVHVAAKDLRPGAGERVGSGVGPGEADDVMTGVDQLRDERRAYEAGGTCEEDSHCSLRDVGSRVRRCDEASTSVVSQMNKGRHFWRPLFVDEMC